MNDLERIIMEELSIENDLQIKIITLYFWLGDEI